MKKNIFLGLLLLSVVGRSMYGTLLSTPVLAKKQLLSDWRNIQKGIQPVLVVCGVGSLGIAGLFGYGWKRAYNQGMFLQRPNNNPNILNGMMNLNNPDSVSTIAEHISTHNCGIEAIKGQIQFRKTATLYTAAVGFCFFAIAYLNQCNINAYELRKEEEKKQNLNLVEKQ